MNIKMRILLTILAVLILSFTIVSGQGKGPLLSDISSEISKFSGKKITITLKLKYIDRVFEKIVFYDRKNIDIEFDISSRQLKEKLKDELMNLHEGMNYLVTFIVIKLGNLGGIIADMDSFKPVILNKIP